MPKKNKGGSQFTSQTDQQFSLAESIFRMQERKRDPDYLVEKDKPLHLTQSEKAYKELIASLKSQNFKKERMVIRHELDSLQIKDTTSPLVRKGNSVLDKLRCDVPEDIYQKLCHNE